jgi:fructokinase
MPGIHQIKRKIYALGETVLDMVSDGSYSFQAIPGGSVLNASVSLGRMKTDVNLITEYGADKPGDLINSFLNDNGVNTEFCIRNTWRKTSLALAFLDNSKKATYLFYHDTPEKITAYRIPHFSSSDILLFGSFYSVKPDRRDFVSEVLKKAGSANSIIYFDLNIRKNHLDDSETLVQTYVNNMAAATIVKGSDEDFRDLFGITDPAQVYEIVKPYCKILIITNGDKPVQLFTPSYTKKYVVPELEPVSTIGAGDNFNAGFIYALSLTESNAYQAAEIPLAEMDKIIGYAIAFATETCLSSENYISANVAPEFWENYI